MPVMRSNMQRQLVIATIGVLLLALAPKTASAIVTGAVGNERVNDPGWPKGAAAVFNVPSRVAWWEGPSLGGQWHAEGRGNTLALNAALLSFSKMESKTKRLVVHNGVGHSFWLNMNNEAAKEEAARIDWTFAVWQLAVWEQLLKAPASIRPRNMGDTQTGPPAQIDVYTGGHIKWKDVRVPEGIEVVDHRLEAHGFTVDDGPVLEGVVTDLESDKPITARIELQLIEAQQSGGYRYTNRQDATTDKNGRWQTKKVPPGWYRLVLWGDGYVPRIVGHVRLDGQPLWQSFDGQLSRPATVSGRVIDYSLKPLAGVKVELRDMTCHEAEYQSPEDYSVTTDAQGVFQFERVPIGTARLQPMKEGYIRPGLGENITTPARDITLRMSRSGELRVTVNFGNQKRPDEYLIEIEPKGGNKVGSWGGSGSINADNTISFSDMPAGQYVVWGHPNPSNERQQTKRVPIDVKDGANEELIIQAVGLD